MTRMRFGQVGGVLVAGGSVACLVAMTIIVAGDNAGNDPYSLALTILPTAVALIAVGALVLGLTGPKSLDGRSIRIGLGMLGAGFLCFMAANVIPAPDGKNNLHLLMTKGLQSSVTSVRRAATAPARPVTPRHPWYSH